MCYHIVSQVASALKHEEQRCGYLTTEVLNFLDPISFSFFSLK
jgi:hypothetical protein